LGNHRGLSRVVMHGVEVFHHIVSARAFLEYLRRLVALHRVHESLVWLVEKELAGVDFRHSPEGA